MASQTTKVWIPAFQTTNSLCFCSIRQFILSKWKEMSHVHGTQLLRPKSLKMPFYNSDWFRKARGKIVLSYRMFPPSLPPPSPSLISHVCSMQTPTYPSSLPRLDGHLQELHQTERLRRSALSNRATRLERPSLQWLGWQKRQGVAKRGDREGHRAFSRVDASGAGVRGHCASSLFLCCKIEVNRVIKRDPTTTNWEFQIGNFMLKPVVRKGNKKWRKEKLLRDIIIFLWISSLCFLLSMYSSVLLQHNTHHKLDLCGCHILVSMPLDFISKAMGTLLGFLLLESWEDCCLDCKPWWPTSLQQCYLTFRNRPPFFFLVPLSG